MLTSLQLRAFCTFISWSTQQINPNKCITILQQDRSQVQQEHNMLKIPFLFYIPSNGFLISVFMNFSPPVIHIFQLLSITLFVYRLFPGWSFTPWQPKSQDHWAPAHVMTNAHERPSPKQLENRGQQIWDLIYNYIYYIYIQCEMDLHI